MGADFTYAIIKVPSDANNVPLPFNDDTATKVIERFNKAWSNHAGNLEDYGIYLRLNETNEDALAHYQEGIRRVFNGGYNREIGHLHLGGISYLITGGMSWGDDPTDSFNILFVLEELDVTTAPF